MHDSDFDKQLKMEFVETLFSELEDCQDLMMGFEQGRDGEVINYILRKIHSLKGSAHSVDWSDIADQLHHVENGLVELKAKHGKGDGEAQKIISVILRIFDQIVEMATERLPE